eukprot:TRINITY_DN10658_c0_g1_i1.p1 TRINITY_DN10658_c0_g1~~TRINITY_DN10658_c0_g1_i1.p1  ORF type:complete len:192 (+),score=38.38 TRINITY_DN10658_c0_g1_i1:43-618(+)
MLRRTLFRLDTKKVITADYRSLGMVYYDPVLAEVESKEGLRELKEVESRKRVVVLVYSKAGDARTKEAVMTVADESQLREVNNKILYAFASYTLDPSLPCVPAYEVYLNGARVSRILGRSPLSLQNTLPKIAHTAPAPTETFQENWPLDTALGFPIDKVTDVTNTLVRAADPNVHKVIQTTRDAYKKTASA